MRITSVERLFVSYLKRGVRPTALDLLPAHHGLGKLERTILHHLGVDAAVGGEVDVLEEGAEHMRIDRRAGLVRLDDDRVALSRPRDWQARRRANQRRTEQ